MRFHNYILKSNLDNIAYNKRTRCDKYIANQPNCSLFYLSPLFPAHAQLSFYAWLHPSITNTRRLHAWWEACLLLHSMTTSLHSRILCTRCIWAFLLVTKHCTGWMQVGDSPHTLDGRIWVIGLWSNLHNHELGSTILIPSTAKVGIRFNTTRWSWTRTNSITHIYLFLPNYGHKSFHQLSNPGAGLKLATTL